jgi:hypothetical protein
MTASASSLAAATVATISHSSFLKLAMFFHHKDAYALEGIKGDARAENIFSGYMLPSQIVTIGVRSTRES